MAERITVFGGAGYVGSALVANLQRMGREVASITRENISTTPSDLGHAIYAIGLTSDFRNRPLETIDAHVVLLGDLISKKNFRSFTYLSSTRLYKSEASTDEVVSISASPRDPDDIYTLSKLLGEALLLRLIPDRGRICRLSNVYGRTDQSSNFLTSVIADARADGVVNIMQAAASEKDYIHIEDACRAIEAIALRGKEPIYNVAAGLNTSHQQIADGLKSSGISVNFRTSQLVQFRPINVERLRKLMDWNPRRLIDDLPSLLSVHRDLQGITK
jgi:nucleoside-diphosphate-sugar epimerase